MQLAGERGGQVEAEAVDVHVEHPVAQAVHEELDGARVPHVERVAAAGVVDVVAKVLGGEAVVGRVVDAAERQGGPEVVALRGVVVDHVEDHLDAGPVERLHHLLELVDLLAEVPGRRVARVGAEEPDRVVAPVVGEAAVGLVLLGHRVVHGQQLDRGHPQLGEVADRGGRGEARVGAAQLRRHLRVAPGEPLHVHLVDDGARPAGEGRPVALPVERRVHHHALGQVRGAVPIVRPDVARGIADPVAEERVVPLERARDRLRVGIQQGLGRIEAVPLAGLVGTVHPEGVEGARPDAREVHVPDLIGALLDPDLPDLLAGVALVVQAERHRGGVLAEEREVDAGPVPRRAERIRPARARARAVLDHSRGGLRRGPARPRRAAAGSAPPSAAGRARGWARSARRPSCPRRRRRRARRRC